MITIKYKIDYILILLISINIFLSVVAKFSYLFYYGSSHNFMYLLFISLMITYSIAEISIVLSIKHSIILYVSYVISELFSRKNKIDIINKTVLNTPNYNKHIDPFDEENWMENDGEKSVVDIGIDNNNNYLPYRLNLNGYAINNLDGIEKMTNAYKIDISHNNIRDIKLLENLKKIKILLMHDNDIEEFIDLNRLPNISYISIDKELKPRIGSVIEKNVVIEYR